MANDNSSHTHTYLHTHNSVYVFSRRFEYPQNHSITEETHFKVCDYGKA